MERLYRLVHMVKCYVRYSKKRPSLRLCGGITTVVRRSRSLMKQNEGLLGEMICDDDDDDDDGDDDN